jgi:hypothetical protein
MKKQGFVVSMGAVLTLLIGCVPEDQNLGDPGPPIQEGPSSVTEKQSVDENPLSKESLSFEDIVAGLEPGIELSNDPWDPWNDISATWGEIFSPNSRTIYSHPYLAQSFEATLYSRDSQNGAGTLGLIDPTSFCLDSESSCVGAADQGGVGTGHGQRMALNAIHEYPQIGIEAISQEAYFVPLFGEVDGRYQAMSSQLGIDGLTNPILYAISAFALTESEKAKVVVAATSRRWEFNDTDGLWNGYPFGDTVENRENAQSQGPAWVNGYEWLLQGDEEIQVETDRFGTWSLNRSSYEWAQWWEANQETLDTLLIKSNQNNLLDDSGSAVDCFPASGGLTPDLDQICGMTDTAMAVTGVGMETVLFVCAFDPKYSSVVGLHSGPFLENTVYASGAIYGDTKSCSQATPIVGAIAQKVIDVNPALTAAQVKQILIESADRRTAYRTMSVSGGVSTNVSETVRIVNSQRAVQCARSLACIQ